jgi:cytoskeletal protein RodZ
MLHNHYMLPVMPQTVGEYLKETRTQLGLTLEAIAERTRISPSHLQALEDNDFAKLPPLIFARAYLKEYTRCLSLKESQQADLLLRFAETAGEFYSRAAQVPGKQPQKISRGSNLKFEPRR